MKIYLIEELDGEVIFENNSKIIALNPNVCYQLDNAGIEYQIIEDYYSESELLDKSKTCFSFESEIAWFQEFDDFLQENIYQLKKLDVKISYWYFLHLKYVIDTLVFESIMFEGFLRATNCSSIVHIAPEYENYKMDYTIYMKRNNILLRLIPLLCEKYSVHYKHTVTHRSFNEPIDEYEFRASISPIDHVKNLIRSNEKTLNLYNAFKSESWRNIVPNSHSNEKLNILMLKVEYGGHLFVRDALRKGHNVFLKINNNIYKYSIFGLKKCHSIPSFSATESDLTPWQNASKKLNENFALFEWINNLCGVDISDIFKTQLNNFTSMIAPELFQQITEYIKFFREYEIDFTIAPYEVSVSEIAAVAAARCSKDTKTVCFLHGYSILESDLWDIIDLDHHDIYFAPDGEFYNYFIERKKLYDGQKTKIFEGFGTYLYQKCIKFKEKRKAPLINNKKYEKKQTVIYLPTFFLGGHRLIDVPAYSDTWYYTFQKELLNYFSTQNDINFIWKGLPQSELNPNPIPEYIKLMGFKNIFVATNQFLDHLSSVDRVIIDYPSTALFESAIARIPVMSLYHKDHKIRKSAVDFFGEIVQPFSTIQEALEKVDGFLKSDPVRYLTEIQLSKNDIVQILEDIN